MARISGLPDELLVKILSFLPTKVAVSTSVLSKQWEFLWMWLPKLEFDDYHNDSDINRPISSYLSQDFIHKNLPLYRAHIIESLRLRIRLRSLQQEDFESWVGIAVSRCVPELSISYFPIYKEPDVLLPSSLYTCKSLVTLKLGGFNILVDVPPMGCLLPSLKTLELRLVRYVNEGSLRLLLKCCPTLENLSIQRIGYDNLNKLFINVPSLQRLFLFINSVCSSDGCVIVTPSLKYLKVDYYKVKDDLSESFSIEHMPELEEANIIVPRNPKELLKSVTSTRRLSLRVAFNSAKKTVYRDGIVFNRLEKLELFICNDNWSKLLVQLLKDSPKLQILNLIVDDSKSYFVGYKPVSWNNNHESSVPTCLLKSLETFKFSGYKGRQEERDFLSFIFKHARCLKSTSILGLLGEEEMGDC